MSRTQAARALTAHFAASPETTVRIFRTKCVDKYFEKYPIRFIEDVRTARQYRLLEEAGLATQFGDTATAERCGTLYPESLRIIGIRLTPTGLAEQWPEHHEREGGWDIVPGPRELVNITAITPQPDPLLARVEFQWRVVPTVGGAALGESDTPRGGSATFRREATGWHFLRMGYSRAEGD